MSTVQQPTEENKTVKPEKSIPGYREKITRQLAFYLRRRSQTFSIRAQKLMLITFGAMAGSICIAIIVTAISPPTRTLTPRSNPQQLVLPRIQAPASSPTVDEDIHHLKNFKHAMDSLRLTPGGQTKYDCLFYHRQGLLDSLNYILWLYQQQTDSIIHN